MAISNLAPLGKVTTTAATAKQVTGSSTKTNCYSLVVQALPANTGNVTVGDSTVVASTGVGAMAVLAPGQSITIGIGHEFDASNVYFDVAVSSEGIVGYTVDA